MSLSDQQRRFLEIYQATEGKPFTVKALSDLLKMTADQFLHGRKLKFVLTDLIADKQVIKAKDTYSFTESALVQAPQQEEFSESEFLSELDVALQAVDSRYPTYNPIGEGRVLKQYSIPETPVIPYEDVVIPDAPAKPLSFKQMSKALKDVKPSKSVVIPTTPAKAFENFKLNFSDNPDETVKELAQLVLDQRVKLESQDKLIKEMHELLTAYVKH